MPTLYIAKRRENKDKRSRNTFKHHVAWGVICLLLMSVMAGLWTRSQSLEIQNAQLRTRLVAQQTVPTTCKVDGNWTPNTTTNHSLATAHGIREYLVHIPADFKDSTYYPLVMFYPGKGGGAHGAGTAFGLDALPAITVYPHPTIGKDGVTAWQGAPYSSGADDVAFTKLIIDQLESDLCIDRTRVYAVGFSNGGAFASLLSCKLPERFAAYAVIAGAMYDPEGSCQPQHPAPLINVHSDNDTVVPYDGSIIRRLPQIDKWISERAATERCNRPTVTNPDVTTVITTWEKCRNGGIVQNVRIVGGIHAWGTVPNTTLWDFLSRFKL